MSAKHLVGIIPVAGQSLDFNFPWHDCLQPIGTDYLAVERSVVECANAGCKTIWVVCHDDMQPLIRHRLGDYVQDPVYLYRNFDPGNVLYQRKPIPIQYVPIHPKDRDRRDCLAWSALYGAQAAYWTSIQISRWLTPDKYYVSFPYGAYDPELLREHRIDIKSDKTFFLSYEGKTIKDGEYLGFTFNEEQFIKYRKDLREKGTSSHILDGEELKRLPPEEKWSARYFSLDEVFGSAIIDEQNVVELPWYHNIGSWKGLRSFLGSDIILERPSRDMLSAKGLDKLGEFNDEEQ